MPSVIERDEVLHVARLARLALAEDEIEPMARELSAVLDHIAHRRAGPERCRSHLPRRRGDGRTAPRRAEGLAAARDRARPGSGRERRGLPRPKPAGMSGSEILDLSAAAAAAAD